MNVDDAIDQLYSVAPEEFTARRGELAAAAKQRGDREGAKLISAARRPTVAAWVVNSLVRADDTARARLAELGGRLREAHSAMDGGRIRELSAAQRKLVDELVRAGFAAAEVSQPSAALRDDVVGTLQAAVADPAVATRLGRLEKAEQWSGFGDFGADLSDVAARTAKPKAKPDAPAVPKPSRREMAAAKRRVAAAERDVRAAEQAHATAVEALSGDTATLAAKRRRYEKLLESLAVAERELNTAAAAHEDALRAATSAAEKGVWVRV